MSVRPGAVVLTSVLLSLAPTAASASQVPARRPTSGVFPYPMAEAKLDNGLRTVVIPTDARGMFALYAVVGTGSRDEVEPGHSGFAHFFEHMMFRGTVRFPSDKRTALLARLGVDESGYTTDDFTTYHLQGPAAALPEILELEGDRFQNLAFNEDDFKTESRAVLGEYNKNASSPDEKAYEALSDLAFDAHTYKHTTMGFLEDIERMPREFAYAQRFFKRFYTPDNVILFVVGDVDAAAVHSLVRKHFGPWRGQRARTTVKDEAPLTRERRRDLPWASPTLDRLHVAWRVPSAVRDPKMGALALVLRGYLFSESSALHQQLVLEERRAETVGAWYDPHRDAALFPVTARITPGNSSDEVLQRIQQALDALAGGTVDTARFEEVRSHLKYAMLMGLTSADSIAGTVAYSAGPFMDPHAIDLTFSAMAELQPSDLASFARAWFRAQQRAVVTVRHGAEGAAP